MRMKLNLKGTLPTTRTLTRQMWRLMSLIHSMKQEQLEWSTVIDDGVLVW